MTHPAGNSFGTRVRVTTFGESHGPAIGGIVEGLPAGLTIDLKSIQKDLDRRRPSNRHAGSTARRESDKMEILSGLQGNRTTGTPLAFLIPNQDTRSHDYKRLKNLFRPGHADLTWWQKYGLPPVAGGGRASGRETAARVAAAGFARHLVREHHPDLTITARIQEIAGIPASLPRANALWKNAIKRAQSEGDSLGGIVQCQISHCPAGLGDPVFEKLHARLGHAILGIPGCRAFGLGEGFGIAELKGSEFNDPILAIKGGRPLTRDNRAAGIQGGISNGLPITFSCAFRPPASINIPQETCDIDGKRHTLAGVGGRHDACFVPRVLPVVEAMAWLVLADLIAAE
jgi:chorismate synthase